METESTFPNDYNSTKSNGTAFNKNNNKDDDDSKAVAAANLIKTLDTALSEMSNLSTNAARNVEDARRTAREASEVARRYTARSYQHSTPTSHENGFLATKHVKHVEKETRKDANTQKRHESSSERLARSHAQDVLSLSLELERTKQALQQECMAHDATRSTLSQARAQQTILTTQLEQVQQQVHSLSLQKEEAISQLQQDLLKAKEEKKAAEDDAQLALDLAKGNAESREQLESWLERALQEVQVLRGQLTSHYNLYAPGTTNTTTTTMLATTAEATPQPEYSSSSNKEESTTTTTTRRSVRFAESPTVLNENKHEEDNETTNSTPRRLVASRSMVAAGRHLLHRATTDNHSHDIISQAPLQSAQRLRQRLLALRNDDTSTSSSHAMVVSCHESNCATTTTSTNIMRLLQSCATRLGIHHLTTSMMQHNHNNNEQDQQVESMTRQFCNTVESKLKQQKEDIQELQALCEYLENKLLIGTDGDGATS